MSFTQATKPRIGEIARCMRCERTWIGVLCECGVRECGSRLVSPSVVDIEGDIAALLVADRVAIFCPRCWTDEERVLMLVKQRAETRGERAN